MRACICVCVGVDDPLTQSVKEFVSEGRKERTNSNYEREQIRYIQWCKEKEIDVTKPNPTVLAAYIAQAWKEKKIKSASVANTARSAVSDLYKYATEGEKSVGESKIVRDVYKTITRTAEPSVEKDPLLREHFTSIFPLINLEKFIEVRAYYCMLLMYALGRRGGEMTNIKTKNVVNDERNMIMNVTLEPAKQGRRKIERKAVAHAPNNPEMNVNLWHDLYMKLRRKENEGKEGEFLFQ